MAPDSGFGGAAVMDTLAASSLRSGATALAARFAQLIVQLGAAMVLARLLTPADFGVQAMVLPVALLVNSLANQGLQSAVIHGDALEEADASGIFFAALPINALLTSGMALSGWLFAWVYGEPRVVAVTVLWAGIVFAAALSSVHEALLKRQLRFAALARAQLATHVISFAIAIVAARAGAGYWALLLQVAVMELGRAASMWLIVPWRPRRIAAGGAAVRELRRYWLSVIGARALSWVGDQSDRVAVNALGGAGVAGLYDSAKRWTWFAFFELFIPLTDVAVATLSRLRAEPARLRAYTRQALLPVAAVALPVAAFMFVEAQLVLQVLLGSQWLGAVVFVRWLSLALVGTMVGRLMQWVYLSIGHTGRQLRWAFVTTPALGAAVVVGAILGGPVGVAAGLAVASWGLALPNVLVATRGTPLRVRDCAAVFARPLAAAATAAALLAAVRGALPDMFAPVALLLRLALFAAAYALAWMLLPGGRAMLQQAARTLIVAGRRPSTERATDH
ncbi:MAG: oligosaccharide flippase family protein [Gemmatimonadaceae bacterium]